MREVVLFEVFLDLQKTYNALDQDRCFVVIATYGVGPRTIRLLWKNWGRLTMVARSGRYFGYPFKRYRDVIQGYPLSPKIFNTVVNTVIRHWVALVAPTKDGTEVLGLSIQDLVAYLYADNGLVTSTQTERL